MKLPHWVCPLKKWPLGRQFQENSGVKASFWWIKECVGDKGRETATTDYPSEKLTQRGRRDGGKAREN